MTKKHSKLKKVLLILSILIIAIFGSLITFFTVLYNKYDLNTEKLTSLNNGIKVYSASGNDSTLYNTNRSIVEIETLPNYVKKAFIDVEDKRFYSHNGYDIKRIAKSILVNFATKSKSQGASTISQQLIKNTLLTNEKTYKRKVKEIVLAIKMEKEFSKEEILEMYLNSIYFGSNAYGIENASKVYFDKSAKDLTITEACCLAGIIKSPKTYSPKLNIGNAIKRRNVVAKQMLSAKDISDKIYEEIISTPIEIANKKQTDNGYEEEAIYEACNILGLSERELINKKYQIITFKQDDLQEEVIKATENVLTEAEQSTSSTLDSLSIVANNKGHVVAFHANSNYNLHDLKRQPASTLKPLAVYLPCFEHNILSPASLILDEEINYNGFQPQNADKKYRGFVSCRDSLSHSLNIPTVKALDYLGVKKAKAMLENLGINITNSDLNLSLALGSVKNGVKMLDLLASYMTLANLGNYTNLCFVNKIKDEKGNTIYSHENFSTKVVGEDSCFLVTDILKDCANFGTAKRLASLNLSIASKTGTASNEKGNTDLYNIAYSSEHTLLTWVADIDKSILPSSLLSSSQPTSINKEILLNLYSLKPPKDFEVPSSVKRCAYDLVELETNNILVQPNHSIERYIAYDYFKERNMPIRVSESNCLNLDVNINKFGTNINFDVKRNMIYKICKETINGLTILNTIKETNGNITFRDSNVFSFDEVQYYIANENNERISDIKKIRPKDYLITILNNEVLSSKKKWLV